ncbi:MAG: hypothetical protein CMJ64_01195 [Planctomycetaceae bacterium]|nr:hypothetical protein [Planctomycetaceae bacterium]
MRSYALGGSNLVLQGTGRRRVYGLQRMPVTLYVEQWERLLDFGDEVRRFAKEHASELKRKG